MSLKKKNRRRKIRSFNNVGRKWVTGVCPSYLVSVYPFYPIITLTPMNLCLKTEDLLRSNSPGFDDPDICYSRTNRKWFPVTRTYLKPNGVVYG